MAFGKIQDIPQPCPSAGEPQPCLTLLSCEGGLSPSGPGVIACAWISACVCVCVQTELHLHSQGILGSTEHPRVEQGIPGSPCGGMLHVPPSVWL